MFIVVDGKPLNKKEGSRHGRQGKEKMAQEAFEKKIELISGKIPENGSIRKQFERLLAKENLSEKDLDRFINKYDLDPDPEEEAYIQYIWMKRRMGGLSHELSMSAEGSINDWVGLMECRSDGSYEASLRAQMKNLRDEIEKIRPIAAPWGRFVRDPEFV